MSKFQCVFVYVCTHIHKYARTYVRMYVSVYVHVILSFQIFHLVASCLRQFSQSVFFNSFM
jgi:hypothetical protein